MTRYTQLIASSPLIQLAHAPNASPNTAIRMALNRMGRTRCATRPTATPARTGKTSSITDLLHTSSDRTASCHPCHAEDASGHSRPDSNRLGLAVNPNLCRVDGSHERLGTDRALDERRRPVGRLSHGVRFLADRRSEEHTSELQSRSDLVCRLL